MTPALSWLTQPLPIRRAVLILFLSFAVSRVAYYSAGVRFDLRPLTSNYQLVDPALLQTRLIETCWYMHTQPPGFNFLVGIVLKLVAGAAVQTIVFGLVYLVLSLSSVFTLFFLQCELGVFPLLALILAALFSVSPGLVLHENILMYEIPQLFALLAGALALIRLFRSGTIYWLAVFYASIAGIAILRATYHLLWVAIAGFGVIYFIRRCSVKRISRQMVAAQVLACAAVGVFYVKNFELYHQFAASTFLGVQANSVTSWQLTAEKREEFISRGLISPASRIAGASPLSAYGEFVHPVPRTGIPILDNVKDSTGRDNLNNLQYLQVGDIYIRDAKVLLRIYPQCYLKSVAIAWFTYFLPDSDFPYFDYNRPKIATWDRWFNVVVFGQWKDASDRKKLRREGAGIGMLLYEGTYLLVLLPLAFCYGVSLVIRDWRGKKDPARTATVAFMLFTIATVSFISTMFASFEGNRYRFPLDGFFIALLGMGATTAVTTWVRRPSRAK